MKDIVFLIPLVLCACGNNKNQIAVSHNNMTSFDSDTLWIDEPDNTPTCHYDPILRKWFGPGSDEMNGTKYEYYDEDDSGYLVVLEDEVKWLRKNRFKKVENRRYLDMLWFLLGLSILLIILEKIIK